jgi:cGMP-dependent protein kinase
MVEEDGYLKMIDMGTCKKLEIGNCSIAKKTFTIIGTPNYMAPEIITGKGYSCAADLWSLGIVMYEFMAGEVPFGENF